MSATPTKVDHSRNLCGEPDLTTYGLSPEAVAKKSLPRSVAEHNPPSCLCCGSTMKVEDCTSEDMNQLGMYWLLCPTCPRKPNSATPDPNPYI